MWPLLAVVTLAAVARNCNAVPVQTPRYEDWTNIGNTSSLYDCYQDSDCLDGLVQNWESPYPVCGPDQRCHCPACTHRTLDSWNTWSYFCGDCGVMGASCSSDTECPDRCYDGFCMCRIGTIYYDICTVSEVQACVSTSNIVLTIVLMLLLILNKLFASGRIRRSLRRLYHRCRRQRVDEQTALYIGEDGMYRNPLSDQKTASCTVTNSEFIASSDDPDMEWAMELSRQLQQMGSRNNSNRGSISSNRGSISSNRGSNRSSISSNRGSIINNTNTISNRSRSDNNNSSRSRPPPLRESNLPESIIEDAHQSPLEFSETTIENTRLTKNSNSDHEIPESPNIQSLEFPSNSTRIERYINNQNQNRESGDEKTSRQVLEDKLTQASLQNSSNNIELDNCHTVTANEDKNATINSDFFNCNFKNNNSNTTDQLQTVKSKGRKMSPDNKSIPKKREDGNDGRRSEHRHSTCNDMECNSHTQKQININSSLGKEENSPSKGITAHKSEQSGAQLFEETAKAAEVSDADESHPRPGTSQHRGRKVILVPTKIYCK